MGDALQFAVGSKMLRPLRGFGDANSSGVVLRKGGNGHTEQGAQHAHQAVRAAWQTRGNEEPAGMLMKLHNFHKPSCLAPHSMPFPVCVW